MATSPEPAYDVFVSYRRTTVEAAEALARELARRKLVVWIDLWKLIPGEAWKPAVEKGLAESRSCAVLVGPEGLGPWQQEESYAAVDRRVGGKGFRVIPVLLPGTTQPTADALPAFLKAATWVRFPSTLSDEGALHRLECGIRGISPEEGPGRALYEGECPYVDLRPFTSAQRRFFFGREAKVARLVERAGELHSDRAPRRFLAVVGPSGSGKSSILQAGFVPALNQGAVRGSESWPVVTLRPGADPIESLAVALASVRDVPLRALVDDLSAEKATLHRFALQTLGTEDPTRRLVVVVDQFEEVFTLSRPERAARFLDNLLHAAAEPKGPVLVVVALSSGFYDRCLQREDLAAALADGQELVGRMSEDDLRRVVESPAQLVGVELEPGLADVLVQDAGTHPAALPLLQHVLYELWQRRHGRTLRTEDYRALGRLSGALEKHAEATFGRLDAAQQEVCRRVFLRLTALGEGVEDTRRRAPLDEVVPMAGPAAAATRAVVDELDAQHLLTLDADPRGRPMVEPHDALIRNWPRLRRWLDEDRPGLRVQAAIRDAAREWVATERKDEAFLFSGSRLAGARKWARAHPDELNADEKEFLARSEASRVLRRRLVWGGVAVALVLAVAAGVNLIRARVARAGEEAARAGERRARWLGLINASRGAESDLGLSLHLAREATRFTDLPAEPAVSQLHAALRGTPWTRQVTSNGFLLPQPEEDAFLVRSHGTLAALDFQGHVLAEMPDRSFPGVTTRTYRREGNLLWAHCEGHCQMVSGRTSIPLSFVREGESPSQYRLALSRDGRTILGVHEEDAEILRYDWNAKEVQRSSVPREKFGQPILSPMADCVLSLEPAGARPSDVRPRRAHVWGPTGEHLAAWDLPPVRSRVDALFAPGTSRVLVAHQWAEGKESGFAGSLWDYASGEARSWRDTTPGLLVWPLPGLGLWGKVKEGRTEGFLTQVGGSGDWAAFGRWPSASAHRGGGERRRGWFDDGTGVDLRFLKGEAISVRTGAPVRGLSLDSAGPRTLTAATRGVVVRRWGAGGECTGFHHVPVPGRTAQTVAFSRDGTKMALEDENGRVVLANFAQTDLARWDCGEAVLRAAFGPRGDLVVTADQGEACATWDLFGTLRREVGKDEHKDIVRDARIAPSEKWIVTCALTTARLWTMDGTSGATLSGHEGIVTSAVFSPTSGERVVTASVDGTFGVWDLEGKSLGRFPVAQRPGPLSTAVFSPDETMVLTASVDGTARLWTPDGKTRGVALSHGDAVRCAVFSPAGDRILTTSLDRTACLWTLGGEKLVTLRGHLDEVTWGDFSPDGNLLATASRDGTARLWTLAGEMIAVLSGHAGPVTSVFFSPRGDRLLTASIDGTARLWYVRTEDLIAAADLRLQRQFTSDELAPYQDLLTAPR